MSEKFRGKYRNESAKLGLWLECYVFHYHLHQKQNSFFWGN